MLLKLTEASSVLSVLGRLSQTFYSSDNQRGREPSRLSLALPVLTEV